MMPSALSSECWNLALLLQVCSTTLCCLDASCLCYQRVNLILLHCQQGLNSLQPFCLSKHTAALSGAVDVAELQASNVHCCIGREDRQLAETGWLCKPLKSITFVDVYGSTVTPTTAQLIKAASNSTFTCTSWECHNLCLFVIDRWWGSRSSSVHLLGKLCQHAGLKGATSNC